MFESIQLSKYYKNKSNFDRSLLMWKLVTLWNGILSPKSKETDRIISCLHAREVKLILVPAVPIVETLKLRLIELSLQRSSGPQLALAQIIICAIYSFTIYYSHNETWLF